MGLRSFSERVTGRRAQGYVRYVKIALARLVTAAIERFELSSTPAFLSARRGKLITVSFSKQRL